MANILFSGIDKENGFNEEQSACLNESIKTQSAITFIASDFTNTVKSKDVSNKMVTFFEKIGVNFKCVNLIDVNISIKEAHEILKASDIVFLMGGDPYLQMEGINKYGLKEYIKNIPLVIGVSAGSMNQSKRVVYEDENNMKLYDYEGLGLINFNIYPHYDFKNIELLKESFRVSEVIALDCLPEDSFIKVNDGHIKYYGPHYKVNNNEIDIKGHDYNDINNTGTIPLESERLIYRRTVKSDIDEFFFIQLNPNLRKYLGMSKVGNNLIKNRNYFDENKYNDKDYYRWTIVKKEDNKILGCIYLNIHDKKAKTAGIDYWIREDEWGCGYVTEAAKRILEFAFDTLNLNRIESCGAKDNPGTWKVMEHIGLKYEGVRESGAFYYYGGLTDLVMYGITRDEYLLNKNKSKTI